MMHGSTRPADLPAGLRAAVSAWPRLTSPGAPIETGMVRMFGVRAVVAHRPDVVEQARRDAAGLGPLASREVCEALMELPAGLPVPSRAVSDQRTRRALLGLPGGVVDIQDGGLVRRAVPPLVVELAVVAARTWQDGLTAAARFAPFCTRAVVLSEVPGDLDEAIVEACFHGVGICLAERGSVRVLVDPEPYVRQRHSSAQWWFAEEIHRQTRPRPRHARQPEGETS